MLGAGTRHINSLQASETTPVSPHHSMPQRMADLAPLIHKSKHAKGDAQHTAQGQLDAELSRRRRLDDSVQASVAALMPTPHMQAAAAAYATELFALPAHELAGVFTKTPLPTRPAAAPVVDDWDCLRGMVGAWEASCGELGDYGMQHTRTFANLCNVGLAPAALAGVAPAACGVAVESLATL
jgi:legumain